MLAAAVLDWEEVAKDEDIKELMRIGHYASLEELINRSVNGAFGYRETLKSDLEAYEGIVDYQNNKR